MSSNGKTNQANPLTYTLSNNDLRTIAAALQAHKASVKDQASLPNTVLSNKLQHIGQLITVLDDFLEEGCQRVELKQV